MLFITPPVSKRSSTVVIVLAPRQDLASPDVPRRAGDAGGDNKKGLASRYWGVGDLDCTQLRFGGFFILNWPGTPPTFTKKHGFRRIENHQKTSFWLS